MVSAAKDIQTSVLTKGQAPGLSEDDTRRKLFSQQTTAAQTYHDYTVGWICALPVEVAAARGMLDEQHSPLPSLPHDDNSYAFGVIGDHNVVIACLPVGVTGTSSATKVACFRHSSQSVFI